MTTFGFATARSPVSRAGRYPMPPRSGTFETRVILRTSSGWKPPNHVGEGTVAGAMTESEARAKTAAVPQIDLLFLCLARDCEATIPEFLAFLDRLEAHGFRCSAIVGENGSRDGTRKLIEAAAHRRVGLLDTAFMQKEPVAWCAWRWGGRPCWKAPRNADWAKTTSASPIWTMSWPFRPSRPRCGWQLKARTDHSLFAVGATLATGVLRPVGVESRGSRLLGIERRDYRRSE